MPLSIRHTPRHPCTSVQVALRALEQLLAMGRSAAGVAALLREAPALDADLQRGADLPPAQGGWLSVVG